MSWISGEPAARVAPRVIPMRHDHQDDVVDLRRSAFDNELDVALGRSYASGFVDAVASCRQGICLVAIEDSKVIGYVLGIPSTMTARIRRALVPTVLGCLLRRPWALLNKTVRNRLTRRIGEELGLDQRIEVSESQPNLFLLLSIAVDPSSRRQGIGRLLAESFANHAFAADFAKVSLVVSKSNESAIEFYNGLGWNPPIDAGEYLRFTRVLSRNE